MGNAKTGSQFRTLGLDINFPFEPYGIQKSMMSKITSTLMNKEHSLIESPTGTGKTLVLLCSTLAWVRHSQSLKQPFVSSKIKKKQADDRRLLLRNKPCSCGRRPDRSELAELKEAKNSLKKQKDLEVEDSDPCFKPSKVADNFKFDVDESVPKRMKLECESDSHKLETSPYFKKGKVQDPDCIIIDDEDDEDSKDHKGCQIIEPENKSPVRKDDSDKPLCKSCAALEVEEKFSELLGDDSMDGDGFISNKFKSKIPKIYYGTRTHKQITQVIRELNKTSYKENLNMCILSSRERTCINPDVKDQPNKNDLCQELIKNKQSNDKTKSSTAQNQDTCKYYQDSNTISALFEGINLEYDSKAWDIEDAASFGLAHEACPYYGVRSLQVQADITFSPYNYLLDPTIRKNLDINLNNSIVIFDEAHNIEDICRDSASFIINTRQIDDILETIQVASHHYVQGSVVMDAYQFFRDKFLQLKGWLVKFPFMKSDEDGYTTRRVLSQNEMRDQLQAIGLGSDCLSKVKENLNALKGDDEDDGAKSSKSSEAQQPALNFVQMQFITQLSITLEFMYTLGGRNFNDFRTVVSRSVDQMKPAERYNPKSHNRASTDDVHVHQFSILCMNSGIAFEKIHSSAWSVIVASGTLSPIESLKSELGCTFLNSFEGNHVIQKDRIFASVLSSGPKKIDLNCAFANSQRLDFQDEVGFVVRDICKAVPNGVLCFFPSYDRMEAFYQRWFARGIIIDIQKSGKKLFREKKNLTPADFERDLENYHKLAKKKGALLFAVYRGKVSEGIDFADEAARAVITIGIPYPNIKEVTVGLKKDYNDIARSDRPYLMQGRDWYASQAFRALNQALGRCIRHKLDWGAIVMIDSRLNNQHSLKNISKWLRSTLSQSDSYDEFRDKLQEYVNTRCCED